MEPINTLRDIDIINWFVVLIILLCAASFVMSKISEFFNYIDKPIKWFNRNNKYHALLLETIDELEQFKEKQIEDNNQAVKHDKAIKSDLENIKHLVYDQIISSWRFEILDMASAISLGRRYSKEQYDHIIEIHEKYESLLTSIGQTNGMVDASMEVIMETYKERLKNGFK